VAHAWALAPDSGADPAWLVSLAEPGVARKPRDPRSLYVLGLAYYRAGRDEHALQRLRESLAANPAANARAVVHPVLALAHFRKGQLHEARQALDDAAKAIDEWTDRKFKGEWFESRAEWDWLGCRALYREAKRVIDGSPPPEDARLVAVRGRAFAVLGRRDQADAEYARAVRLAPADPQIRLACFRYHAEHGRWDEAAAAHAEAVRLSPDDARVRLERVRYHAERGEVAEADKALAADAAHRSNDAEFHIWCGDALADLGLWPYARDAYARAIALDPKDGAVWFKHGVLQLYLGDEAGFRRTFAGLVERYGPEPAPRTAWWLAITGIIAADAGVDPERLVQLVNRWATINPNDAQARLGIALFRAKRYDEAIAELRKARGSYDWPQLKIVQALAHYRNGDFSAAQGLMGEVPAGYWHLNPKDPVDVRWEWVLERQLYYQQAEAEIQSHRWREFLDCLKRRQWAEAIRLIEARKTPDHNNVPRWTGYGNLLAEVGRWKDAAAAFARASELAPENAQLGSQLARLRLQLGDEAGYRQVCADLIARHAQATDPRTLNQVAWACVLAPAGGVDPATVVQLAQKSADALPRARGPLHTLGCALVRAGRYEEAIKTLQKSERYEQEGGNPWDWLFLALAHHHLGQREEARKYLDQSVAWMDRHPKGDGPIPGSTSLFLWPSRVELSLFRREVETLLNGRPMPAAKGELP
jgi:tetratricopeptide (TPR) repeat protein